MFDIDLDNHDFHRLHSSHNIQEPFWRALSKKWSRQFGRRRHHCACYAFTDRENGQRLLDGQ